MNRGWKDKTAQWLAARSGSRSRADEIHTHLDALSMDGAQLSTLDVASLALLCIRTATLKAVRQLPAALAVSLGAIFVCLGLAAMLFPFISVHRLSTQAIDLLPSVRDAVLVDDAKGALAIFDDDNFLLATRTYEAIALEEVEAAFIDQGYHIEYGPTPKENGFSLDCCGEYDQLLVYLEVADNGVHASVTARDADVTAAWPVVLFFGAALAFVGAGLFAAGRHSWRKTTAARRVAGLSSNLSG